MGAKFHMLSLFLRNFFFKLGPKIFFLSLELLRPLVSVNNDFLNFPFLNSGSCAEGNRRPIEDDYTSINVFPDLLVS
jgi:hypothetical protein